MAAIPYPQYDVYSDGTANVLFDIDLRHTATTATISNVYDLPIQGRTSSRNTYYNGICFENKKLAIAYKNLIKSQEQTKILSFFKKKTINRTIMVNKKPHNAPSRKQFHYNKRKKFKEKMGLKH